jgi:hypothetical protein
VEIWLSLRLWHKFGNIRVLTLFKLNVMQVLKTTAARITFLLLTLLVSVVTFAQESGGGADINVDINKDSGSTWYTNPVVWIVGAAVFILLLVALLRGNRARD